MPQFEEVVRRRRSTRAFDSTREVDDATLRQVLELAQRSPSNCNAQPWHVYVVSGSRCAQLRRRLLALAEGDAPQEENATPDFQGALRERQVACAVELYRALGVSRRDLEGRRKAALRNFAFFDAPHVALLYMDRSWGLGVALDVGAYLQTLLLAFEAHGIGACAQASLRVYAGAITEELQVPENLRLMCGVSFGYALVDAPVNAVEQTRTTGECVHFLK